MDILDSLEQQGKAERKVKREQSRPTKEATQRARRSKSKGREGENEVVKLLQRYGITSERIPLSGALKSEKYSCDVAMANGKRIEVKRRKSGMKTIQSWLNEDANSNYVFFREDGDTEGWVVIMPYLEFVDLVQKGAGK